jgi:hypothetical protein
LILLVNVVGNASLRASSEGFAISAKEFGVRGLPREPDWLLGESFAFLIPCNPRYSTHIKMMAVPWLRIYAHFLNMTKQRADDLARLTEPSPWLEDRYPKYKSVPFSP